MCSPTNTSTKDIFDRKQQIEPSFVFTDSGAVCNRKHTDLRPKITKVVACMASVAGFRGMVSPLRMCVIVVCLVFATPLPLRTAAAFHYMT